MDSATLYRAIIITEKTLVYLKRSECLFKPDIGRRQNYSSRKVLGKKKKNTPMMIDLRVETTT